MLAVMLLLTLVPCGESLADGSSAETAFSVSDGTIRFGADADGEEEPAALSVIVPKYRQVLAAGMGILAVTMFVLMMVQFAKLGAAGDNPMLRRKAIVGIATTGIATALLGGLSVYIGILRTLLAPVTA